MLEDRAWWSTMAIRSEPEDWRPPWIGTDDDMTCDCAMCRRHRE